MNNLSKENFINRDHGFPSFDHISLDPLNKHAPCKNAQGNQIPFFNKKLSKVIMMKIKLRNIFQQNRSEENRIYYTKHRSFCVSLWRKKKEIRKSKWKDNKLFWKTVKLLLSDKVAGKDEVHLIENYELVKTDLETAEVLTLSYIML